MKTSWIFSFNILIGLKLHSRESPGLKRQVWCPHGCTCHWKAGQSIISNLCIFSFDFSSVFLLFFSTLSSSPLSTLALLAYSCFQLLQAHSRLLACCRRGQFIWVWRATFYLKGKVKVRWGYCNQALWHHAVLAFIQRNWVSFQFQMLLLLPDPSSRCLHSSEMWRRDG